MAIYNKEVFTCVLNQIPWHKNNPEWTTKDKLISASKLTCTQDVHFIEGYIESIILILDLFDLIDIKDDSFRIKGQIPFYFINCLKWYITNDEKLISNWDRPGVGHDINVNNLLDKAPYLLKLLEYRKKEICQIKQKPIESSRKQKVSIVLIKTEYKKIPYFLFQWDTRAEQFQLIGGRSREGETEFETAKREFNEEIQLHDFVYNRDYTLEPLISNIKITDISRSFGALTDYEFSFFLAKIKIKKIKLTEVDRWISIDEMEKGRTKNGKIITDILYFKFFNKNLPDGFKGVDNSLNQNQIMKFFEHVELKPSFWGITINLSTLINSIFSKK
jgi:8-oxo-dGTP pyrophosphatase MutT (NUDIX family)